MRHAVRAGSLYFVLVFAAGFILGTIRTLIIAPRLGEWAATLVELPIILAIAWKACGVVMRHVPVPPASATRLLMGGTALNLLLIAEALLSTTLGGLTLAQHLALYARPAVLLGLAGQVIYALFPVVKR